MDSDSGNPAKERERHCRYLEREFKEGADPYIYFFISQDLQDAKTCGYSSILEYLFEEHIDFYLTLFTEIFIRDNQGLFHPLIEFWPYLELKALLAHLKIRIPETEGRKRERLLDLYQHYYNYLVNVTLLCRLRDEKRVLTEDHLRPVLPGYVKIIDEGMIRDIEKKYLELIPTFMPGGIPKDIDSVKFRMDASEIYESREFLASEGRNTLTHFENIILGKPVPDLYDGLEYQYKHGMAGVRQNPHEIPGFIQHCIIQLNLMLRLMEFDTAELLVDLLIKDFPADPVIQHYYLDVKLRQRKLDDIMRFIEDNYSPEQVEKEPFLLMCLCEYEQERGNIPDAVEYAKKAFEASDREFVYLIEYAKVLLLKDWRKARDVFRTNVSKGIIISGDIGKGGLTFMVKRFLLRDLKFAKELLDHYERLFLKIDVQENAIYNAEYFSLLYKYYENTGKLESAKDAMELLVRKYPESEAGHRRLSEFHSNKNHGGFFDMGKALCHAKKCAETRGVPCGYYTGIAYVNAKEWDKAIGEFTTFIREIKNVPPAYSRVYMHMFMAYREMGKMEMACEVAGHYLDLYDQPRSLELYKSPTMDTEGLLQDDITFFWMIQNECRKHGKRAQALINQRKLWLGATAMSNEIEHLERELKKLERKNRNIRKRYGTFDLKNERILERFLTALETNELARAKLYENTNTRAWADARRQCESRLSRFNKLPDSIQGFIQTGEFFMHISDTGADFSAVILSYSKALERMLNDNIGQPFIDGKGNISKGELASIKDKGVKNLFGHYHSMSLGQWARFLETKKEYTIKVNDKISQELLEFIDATLGKNMSTVQRNASEFARVRNSCAHLEKTSKKVVESNLPLMRIGIDDISQLFY